MFEKHLFMQVKDYRGYDDFMVPVNKKDKTWKSILDHIQSVLDEKYGYNDDQLEGIKLDIEFVMQDPSEIEWEY